MNILSNLLGGAGPHDGTIKSDLQRLDSVRPGLGDQATKYVRTGDDGTVLASLNVLCKANELEVCRTYVDTTRSTATLARRKLLAQGDPYDLPLMQRYAEVLAATATGIPAKSAARYSPESVSGSEHAPRVLRIFFSEAFMGLRDHHNAWPPRATQLHDKGLLLNNAIAMARMLGGDVIDLFDVLYVSDNAYHQGGQLFRSAVSIRPAVEAHSDAFIDALKRMPAQSRAAAIEDIGNWGLAAAFVPVLVEQAGDGSKAAREAANASLRDAPGDVVAPLAIALLGKGDSDQRAGMVDVLARLRTPTAMEALRAHRVTEKTARIAAAIDTALSLDQRRQTGGADDAAGYTAIGGAHIEIPPLRPLPDDGQIAVTPADRAALHAVIDKHNQQINKQNEENQKRGHGYRAPVIPNGHIDRAVDLFANGGRELGGREIAHLLSWGPGAAWTRATLQKLPLQAGLRVSMRLTGGAGVALGGHVGGPAPERLQTFINGADGDVRHLEQLDLASKRQIEFGDWRQSTARQMQQGDLLRAAIQDAYYTPQLSRLPRDALWPYLAENLAVFDEALGLAASAGVKYDRAAAVRALALLPATPDRYFAPLLEIATGESKSARREAREMLVAAPEVEARLIALLDDTRQAVRAGAADWLSLRRDPGALDALNRRLKKEKSEVARAAILTALKRLGADLSDILGPAALIAEAAKGLKSAKFDKLQWMALDNVGPMRFRDGAKVPADVLRWWVFLAYKLKQPGGNALFDIYLDQLDPKDAESFSTWALESWIGYDTAKPDEAAANAHAKAGAKGLAQMYARYQPSYTEEMAFALLKSQFMSNYPNSGADSKGVLALAVRAPSALAAERVRAFLKSHGQRTSQASALLEMLAGKGDPVALQVVIAAATRLKQKGVQKFAADLITRVAEARDWTLDELADRTVPTAGFDEDGVLTLVCGEDQKVYEARLGPDLGVVLRNPAGKEVANLPSATDETSAASKKQLSTTKKELKQIVGMQSTRLYEALCAERAWSIEDWKRSFHDHPVMRRLVERVVWLGLDADGKTVGAFRPTAEGDFTNTQDEPVDIDGFARVRIAHGALLDDAQSNAWSQHLDDYEIKPLFTQFGRALLRADKDDLKKVMVEDRRGWLTDAFTIRGAAAKLGYERGGPLDGGFFNEYRKPFASAGLAAVIEFTGNSLPEQNVAAALVLLRFERATGPSVYSGAVALGDVPPVLLSECWNDYHAMAAKAKFDAEWEKKAQW